VLNMPTHPEILWAQRSSDVDEAKNIIYLTVNLPDINKDSLKFNLNPDKLTFQAVSGKDQEHPKDYTFEIEFFGEVDPEKSISKLSTRAFDIKIQKKDKNAEYWPRLTKTKNHFVKTNFDKWVDEDDQDGNPVEDEFDPSDMGMGGGGPLGMGGGGPGPGGMDFEKMMADMQRNQMAAGGSGGAADEEEEESDDGGPPPLEDAESSK